MRNANRDGDSWVTDGKGNPSFRRSERFYCNGHYEPWDGHGLILYQGVDVEEGDQYSDEDVWLVPWFMGYAACNHREAECEPILERLKNAWRLLRGKAVSTQEVVLGRDEARRLALYLLKRTESSPFENGRIYAIENEDGEVTGPLFFDREDAEVYARKSNALRGDDFESNVRSWACYITAEHALDDMEIS